MAETHADPGAADDLESLASALVSIPSENPPGEERQCARFVAEWFEERDVAAELVEDPGTGRPSVGARAGEGSPALVLNGHTDVVPAGDPGGWSHDPYAGTVEDGRLYGRGAADMKTGLALAMLTARDLAPDLHDGTLPGSVVVHAAMGEETGDPGTRSLLEAGYGGDAAVVLEPTDLRVATSAKGVATYRIEIEGRAAHASHPGQAESALEAACALLDAVADYEGRLGNRVDPLCGRAHASVTELTASGGNMAVIPDRADLLVDRRVLPEESITDVEREVEELLDRIETARNVRTDRELVQHYASSSIPPDHSLAVRFRDRSAERAGVSAQPWGLEAATDAREFVARGVPAIVWGPGSLDQAHTADEWIDLDEAVLGLELLLGGVRESLAEGI